VLCIQQQQTPAHGAVRNQSEALALQALIIRGITLEDEPGVDRRLLAHQITAHVLRIVLGLLESVYQDPGVAVPRREHGCLRERLDHPHGQGTDTEG
jgi:hypothetical protein